jgi:hypothetical protein
LGAGPLALQNVFDGGGQCVGDAGYVAAQLAGAIGFPLGDGAAANVAGDGQLILRHPSIEAEGADSGADCFWCRRAGLFWHGAIL